MSYNVRTMKHKVILSGLIAISLLFISGFAHALGQYTSGSTGIDVSFPNCQAKIPNVSFGIVGVTGGLAFSQNPCLALHASKFTNLSLYTNTGYPGHSYAIKYQSYPKPCEVMDLNCLAYNYGYNAAEYAYNYADKLGVKSSTWWLDVELENSWTGDPIQNIKSIEGQIDSLKSHKVETVGIYSTTYQWGQITNSWQNGLPSWGATTWRTAKQAATYCKGHEFTGGPSYLMQYIGKSLDQNVAC
jgi:hypothetical protein